MERSRAGFDSGISGNLPRDTVTGGAETLRALAERVLFSGDLEEKLRLPGTLLPDEPGGSRSPGGTARGLLPGRPDELRFAAPGSPRPVLPSAPGLVDEENRGLLLHFFANHELLAAELMALALLRFPDAPTEFRMGLAETLVEEQKHTKWYLGRLQQCGVEFGCHPLNRFFWDAVSGMESPVDYVSRLSLTFEQANLDYAIHFAGILREAGDPRTAEILERIYRDEIGHVGYGLRWFRRWKDEAATDWDALEAHLAFPLSPSRAKGNRTPFNAEGRRAAGFDEDYIRRLSLFERSKGRTPNVFLFNPDAEHRVAALPGPWHPGERVESVTRDLELLTAFLSRRDDVVLLRERPSREHSERLAEAGFALPEIEILDPDGALDASGLLAQRHIHRIRPWAKAPDLPGKIGSRLSGRIAAGRDLDWRERDRELFSKLSIADALGKWIGECVPVGSPAEFAEACARFPGDASLVLKRDCSSAGGGMRRIDPGERDSVRIPVSGAGAEPARALLLEPWHRRVFDFSVQYEIDENGIRKLGFTEQVIAPSGGYRGTIAAPKFCSGLDEEIARFLMAEALPAYEEDGELAADLLAWARSLDYQGPVGVDTYLHRAPSGELVHRAICEVNARFTMGRVALELLRRIAPGHSLAFRIEKARDLDAASFAPVIRGDRLAGGSLLLTETGEETRFAATIEVAKQRQDL